MSEPIIISGTTGELGERRFCQFWGPFKVAGQETVECLASMESTVGAALTVNPQCPVEWHGQVWQAFELLVAGGIPEATHSVEWHFSTPRFTLIPVEVAPSDEVPLFEVGELA
ncbi:MAG: hypothetical protein LCH43_11395 [Actinobacteria bacterium]|nr:hypothetical protein [Actinomycetota bacterium]